MDYLDGKEGVRKIMPAAAIRTLHRYHFMEFHSIVRRDANVDYRKSYCSIKLRLILLWTWIYRKQNTKKITAPGQQNRSDYFFKSLLTANRLSVALFLHNHINTHLHPLSI